MIFTWDPIGDTPTTHRVRCDRVEPGVAARDFASSGARGLLLQNLELLTDASRRKLFEHRWTPAQFGEVVTGRSERHAMARSWVERFGDALARLGGRVERLILDVEWGVGPWHIEFEHRVAACRAAIRAAPDHELVDAWERLARAPRDREALQRWITWAGEHRAMLLRELIVDPLRERVGEFAWSNYNDIGECERLVQDRNGWDTRFDTQGGDSSPVLYMVGRRGARYNGHDDRRWATFVDHVDRVRAIVASGRRVVPWLTLPHQVGAQGNARDYAYEGIYLWQELVHHCAMVGVRDWLLWWNPSSAPDVEYAYQVGARVIGYAESFADEQGGVNASGLESLELDAEVVRTGAIETSRDRLLGY